MLTGAVRRVHSGRQHSSFQRTDHRTDAVQAVGRAAAGTQVGRQFHRLLLVQREVSRHAWSSVPLSGSQSPLPLPLLLLRSAVQHRRQLQQRRDADDRYSHRQRMIVKLSTGQTHCRKQDCVQCQVMTAISTN